MTTTLNRLLIITILFVAMINTSCKKDHFDEPPYNTTDPNLTVTKSIKDLKAFYATNGSALNPLTIATDDIISGIVVADDKSGNLYNQIMVDDGTAGITLALNRNSLYNSYPIGRKIYIKIKGMVIGESKGLIELAGSISGSGSSLVLNPVNDVLIDKYIVKGPTNQPYPIFNQTVVNILKPDTLKAYQSRVIRIQNAEFVPADTSKPFADPNSAALSRYLTDCTSGTSKVAVHCSNFGSTWINTNTPSGNGTFTCAVSYYISGQLVIRDLNDVQLTNSRCGSISSSDTLLLNQTFEVDSTIAKLTPAGWIVTTIAGTKNWYVSQYSGNHYVQISAYGSTQASNVSWITSPAINLNSTTQEKLSFVSEIGHPTGNTLLEVFISTNFTGNAATATWTPLSATVAQASDVVSGNFSAFIPSGNIDLSSYSGTVYIGFKYTGQDPTGTANDNTSTYEVDNIKVIGKK